jgi:hypothetical protein
MGLEVVDVSSDQGEYSDIDIDVMTISRKGFDMYTRRLFSDEEVLAMGSASVYFRTSKILVVDEDDNHIVSGRSTVTTNIARSKIVELVLRATVSEDCVHLLNVIIRTLVHLEEHDDFDAIDVESPHVEKDILSVYREHVSPCDARVWVVEDESVSSTADRCSMVEISDRIHLQLTARRKTVGCQRRKTVAGTSVEKHASAAKKPRRSTQ